MCTAGNSLPLTWSPLRVVVHQRDLEAVTLLAAAGADVNERSTSRAVDGGRTILGVAVDIG